MRVIISEHRLFSVIQSDIYITPTCCHLRSVSSKIHPPVSPKLVERKKSSAKKLTTDSAALSSARTLQTHLPSNITVFFLPGVDVKVCFIKFLIWLEVSFWNCSDVN